MALKYFGTDGIRGRVGETPITAEFILKLGWAIGTVLAQKQPQPQVVIARDTRISSSLLQSALTAGLSSAGVKVIMLGVLPTPAVAQLTKELSAAAGIIISASHNPYYDNGIKFFNAQGMKFPHEFETAVEAQLNQPMTMIAADQLGQATRLKDAKNRYVEFCKNTFPGSLNLKSLKIVVDCANGAAYQVAPQIFQQLGAEVIAIANQPNGLNINEACGATDVAILQTEVEKQQADIGVALDGDGDRLILVDHKGERVDGDEILCILAHDAAQHSKKRLGIVGTVMSNLGLEQALQHQQIEFVRTQVGDRYVLEELIQRQWTLGGEPSGHIVNLDFTTTGDGIITALQLLRIMCLTQKTLHQLKKAMVKRPQVLINVPISKTIRLNRYPKISAAIDAAEQKLSDRGRILVRPSGTQPYVRVMVEGNEAQEVQSAAETLALTIQREINT